MKKPMLHALVGHGTLPVPEGSSATVGLRPEVIARDSVAGHYVVSTTFLVIDHRPDDEPGKPLLFETCLMRGPSFADKLLAAFGLRSSRLLDVQLVVAERYETYYDAISGHEKWLSKVTFNELEPDIFWS